MNLRAQDQHHGDSEGDDSTPGGHTVAPAERWPWLPTYEDNGLARHPYCTECGAVKVLGSEAGLKMGTLVNIFGRLTRRLRDDGHTVTEAQRRLILKRLKSWDADDRFSVPRSAQIQLLADAVHDYTGLDARYVRSVLRSC